MPTAFAAGRFGYTGVWAMLGAVCGYWVLWFVGVLGGILSNYM